MLKLTVAALAVALASTAGAAGWRKMRLEATDMASFTKSVAAFEEKLSTARHYVFMMALQDLWDQGTQRAAAEQRDYTESEYFRQLDGLRYEEIVALADPTGETTKERYQVGLELMLAARGSESSQTRAGVSGQHVPQAWPSRAPRNEQSSGRGY